jgi:hypothetical protein
MDKLGKEKFSDYFKAARVKTSTYMSDSTLERKFHYCQQALIRKTKLIPSTQELGETLVNSKVF